MDDDTEYELMPHEQVERLKHEVDKLKANPLVANASDEKLYQAIASLTGAINRLNSLFEGVQKQILDDYKRNGRPEEKLSRIMEQNKSIAEGIVALSDNFKQATMPEKEEYEQGYQSQRQQPSQPMTGMPDYPQDFMAQRPENGMPQPQFKQTQFPAQNNSYPDLSREMSPDFNQGMQRPFTQTLPPPSPDATRKKKMLGLF